MTRQTGFSLTEVLVAFSIFAISSGLLFQIYSKGAHSTRLARDYTGAIIIAKSKLSAIGVEWFPDTGSYQDSEGKYRRVTTVRKIDNDFQPAINPHLIRHDIKVEVSWESGRGERSVILKSIRLFPGT